MARVASEEARAIKRNEILDAAQKLVYSKGYEQMSIQDILDALQISKGAFYHYFNSKPALLDGLVDRLVTQAVQMLQPVFQDPALTALEKLLCYFNLAGQWKTAQKGFLIALLRTWYTDHNAIVRQKHQAMMLERITPLMTPVLRQGVAEGAFHIADPEQASGILMSLGMGLSDTWARVLLADPPLPDALSRLQRLTAAYTQAFERLLGAPENSLILIDDKTLKAWATAN